MLPCLVPNAVREPRSRRRGGRPVQELDLGSSQRAVPSLCFAQVCELDIMNEPDMVHYIMDEMLLSGCVYDTNKQNVLEPIQLLEQLASQQ